MLISWLKVQLLSTPCHDSVAKIAIIMTVNTLFAPVDTIKVPESYEPPGRDCHDLERDIDHLWQQL